MFTVTDFNDSSGDNDDEAASNAVLGLIAGLCVAVVLAVGLVSYMRHQDKSEPLSCLSDSARDRATSSDYTMFKSNNGRDSSYVPADEETAADVAVNEL